MLLYPRSREHPTVAREPNSYPLFLIQKGPFFYMSTNTYTFDGSGDFPQNKNTLRHGAVSSLPPKEKSNPVVPHAAVASGKSTIPFHAGHSLDHADCPACEQARTLMIQPVPLAEMKFTEAAEIWLSLRSFPSESQRSRFISKRTLSDLKQYVSSLSQLFGSIPLNKIHIGNIREYQRMRATGQLSPKSREVGPNKINQEMNTLVRIMKQAGCWEPSLESIYMPLQTQETDVPRALAPTQQEYFLKVASSRPAWQFVYWYALLGLQSPMSTNEQRNLRLGDLDLHNNVLMVRVANSKNKYRTRTIPLSDEARWAIDRMLERAKGMGSTGPQYFLMPFIKGHKAYPEKAMTVTGMRKPWLAVRAAAGVPWFRAYDLRHTCITRLAEAGTPLSIIMDLAGHVNAKMAQHYTHISQQAKRKAVMSAFPQKPMGYQTGA